MLVSSRNCEISLGNHLNEFRALESQDCSSLARLQPGFQFVLYLILLLKEISWVAWGNTGLFTACCILVSYAVGLPGNRWALLPKLLFSPFFSILEVTVFILSLTGLDGTSFHTFCSPLMLTSEQAHIKYGSAARSFRQRWRNVFTACLRGRW